MRLLIGSLALNARLTSYPNSNACYRIFHSWHLVDVFTQVQNLSPPLQRYCCARSPSILWKSPATYSPISARALPPILPSNEIRRPMYAYAASGGQKLLPRLLCCLLDGRRNYIRRPHSLAHATTLHQRRQHSFPTTTDCYASS